jgi:hypothetical protein
VKRKSRPFLPDASPVSGVRRSPRPARCVPAELFRPDEIGPVPAVGLAAPTPAALLFDRARARAAGAEAVRRLIDLPIAALGGLVDHLGYELARWEDRDRLMETVKRVRRNQAFLEGMARE